jgi:hypothetical protein
MIDLTALKAPAETRAFFEPGHWERFRTTKREKSSRLLLVQRDGGELEFLILSTTQRGISV